jgi:hypothetical protein
MNASRHTLLLAAILFATLLPLLPMAAGAEESEPAERETKVTQVLDGLNPPALIYNTGSKSVFIIQEGKPTQFYNKTESGQLINVTPTQEEPTKK